MAFTQKLLSANLTLASGNFGTGGNTLSLSGLRMSAHYEVTGGNSLGMASTLQLAIWGMTLSQMNQLTTFGTQFSARSMNQVQLYAGEGAPGAPLLTSWGQQPNLVFSGQIFEAYIDAKQMPQVCFRITANAAGIFYAVQPIQPTSLPGPQSVSTMMKSLAGKMNFQFQDNGVNVNLLNPYYYGAPWTQALQMAKHAGINMHVERGTMYISPPGVANSGETFLISKDTNLVGYPSFQSTVLMIKILYTPNIGVNSPIQLKSDITPANGNWKPNLIIGDLDCLMPHGQWFQTLQCPTLSAQ